MVLVPDGNSADFMELVDDGLEYLGPRDLVQYFIKSTKMVKKKDGSINVLIVLGRRLLGKAKSLKVAQIHSCLDDGACVMLCVIFV